MNYIYEKLWTSLPSSARFLRSRLGHYRHLEDSTSIPLREALAYKVRKIASKFSIQEQLLAGKSVFSQNYASHSLLSLTSLAYIRCRVLLSKRHNKSLPLPPLSISDSPACTSLFCQVLNATARAYKMEIR